MTEWRYTAACSDEDPELFFPIGDTGKATQNQVDEAKSVCALCPVRPACLRWALDTGEDTGIWGGMTALERRNLRRRTSDTVGRPRRSAADEDRVTALMRGTRIRSSRADKREAAQRLLASGESKTEIARLLRIAWSTLHELLAPANNTAKRAG